MKTKQRNLIVILSLLIAISIGLNIYLWSESPQKRNNEGKAGTSGQLYTCGMHPEVIQDEPGTCPICGMDLVLLSGSGTTAASSGERKIAYWVAPMDPNFISDKPGKSPMGMDLVPVYEDELKSGVVKIDPVTLQNIGVTTEPVQRKDLSLTLRTNGIVKTPENAEYRINPKISGWIEKLYVSRTGDLVKKGEPLLEIYSPELVAAQQEYLLAVQTARSLQVSGLARVSDGSGKLLNSARRRLELWDISNDQIAELEKTGEVRRTLTLHSPAGGVVLHKNAVEGTAVKAGTDLFTVADLDPIWVTAQVFEYELPWVHVGDSAEVYSPYDPALSLKGRVEYVYPYVDSKSRTADVRIVLPNSELSLRPDMYVDVRIETSPHRSALAIPKSSVIRSGERDIVFIAIGDGEFIPREVKLGVEAGTYYEVLDGLTDKMNIVTAAQFLLDSEATLQEAIQRRLQQKSLHSSTQTER
jgi:Cu(I)/Ag(I) efflux system membrane fusion protein/cobalt-zinc-cadmium efflux system membrane fusion protein